MKINFLQLEYFKNISTEIIFGDGVNLIIGKNGVGKSNILESIYFLSSGESYRGLDDRDMIDWTSTSQFSKVNGRIYNSKIKDVEEYGFIIAEQLGIIQKRYQINGLRQKKSEYIYKFPAILFQPEDVSILGGSPDERRKELDMFLKMISREYAIDDIEYKKILKNRNKLLKDVREGKSQKKELDFWNEKLIEIGSKQTFRRIRAIEEFLPTMREFGAQIFRENFDGISINYLSKIAQGGEALEDIQSNFRNKIHFGLQKEILSGQTLYGPQRDDLFFVNGEVDLHKFGSRGQQRLVSLVFKLAMWRYYFDKFGISPVLLLDDMMSELDREHKEKLSNALLEIPAQIIFTSTTLDDFGSDIVKNSKQLAL